MYMAMRENPDWTNLGQVQTVAPPQLMMEHRPSQRLFSFSFSLSCFPKTPVSGHLNGPCKNLPMTSGRHEYNWVRSAAEAAQDRRPSPSPVHQHVDVFSKTSPHKVDLLWSICRVLLIRNNSDASRPPQLQLPSIIYH